MNAIVTVTMNPAVDKSAAVEHVERDTKLRCDSVRRDPGGGGINVARAVSRLGGLSVALYLSGGPMGAYLDRLLTDEGIEHRGLETAGETRENLTVTERSSGGQFRFGMPGPSVTETECQAVLDAVRASVPSGGYVIGSGSLPPGAPDDFYATLAAVVKGAEASFIVDTTGSALAQAIAEGVFLTKPNIDELSAMSGGRDMEDPEIRKAAFDIISSGNADHVVVSLGAGGALYVSEAGARQLAAPTVPIRSRIGAGDSMVGGIVHGLSEGRSMLDAVKLGVAAGAAAVMTDGTELCRGEDVKRLFDEME